MHATIKVHRVRRKRSSTISIENKWKRRRNINGDINLEFQCRGLCQGWKCYIWRPIRREERQQHFLSATAVGWYWEQAMKLQWERVNERKGSRKKEGLHAKNIYDWGWVGDSCLTHSTRFQQQWELQKSSCAHNYIQAAAPLRTTT